MFCVFKKAKIWKSQIHWVLLCFQKQRIWVLQFCIPSINSFHNLFTLLQVQTYSSLTGNTAQQLRFKTKWSVFGFGTLFWISILPFFLGIKWYTGDEQVGTLGGFLVLGCRLSPGHLPQHHFEQSLGSHCKGWSCWNWMGAVTFSNQVPSMGDCKTRTLKQTTV